MSDDHPPIQPRPGYVYLGAQPCKGCPATVHWWRTTAMKPSPHDADGTSHFATCPRRLLFKGVAPRTWPDGRVVE